MQSLIYRHTIEREAARTTTIYILGVPIYRHTHVGVIEGAIRPIGFQYVCDGDAPEEDDPDDEDFETYTIEPYGKKTRQRPCK